MLPTAGICVWLRREPTLPENRMPSQAPKRLIPTHCKWQPLTTGTYVRYATTDRTPAGQANVLFKPKMSPIPFHLFPIPKALKPVPVIGINLSATDWTLQNRADRHLPPIQARHRLTTVPAIYFSNRQIILKKRQALF